jgi:hypothetical protein
MGPALELRLPACLSDETVRRLCAGLGEQLGCSGVTAVVCRVECAAGDLATVDAVARLALVARRAGVAFTLDGTGPGLSSLLGLVGLDAALVPLPDEESASAKCSELGA